MIITNPRVENALRQSFKRLNRLMVWMFRLGVVRGMDWFSPYTGQILVILHHGRRTGTLYRSGVNYALVEGELYCIAAFGVESDWYQNLMAHPDCEIWLPDGCWAVRAEDISDSPDRLFLMRQIIISSGFVAYLFGFRPRIMTDEAIDRATAPYRLIHLRRLHALTGQGGPDDLAFVWIYTTFGLLALIIIWLLKGRESRE